MIKEERFEFILKSLEQSNRVTYESLAEGLAVSEDTVRRDIDQLSKSGLLVKVRGGAITPNKNPLSFTDRKESYTDGKKIIALKACQLLKGVRTVFMDGGTTMQILAGTLPPDAKFRVITNNVALVPILATYPGIELVVLGGTYNRETQTNVGQQACKEVGLFEADIYLMGICAIHSEVGITASLLEDGEIKQAMMQSARKTVVLCNAEKLESTDFFKVASLYSVDSIITDLRSNDSRLDIYRKFDLEIL